MEAILISTHNIYHFQYKKEHYPKLSQICSDVIFSKELKNEFETAMVNKPSCSSHWRSTVFTLRQFVNSPVWKFRKSCYCHRSISSAWASASEASIWSFLKKLSVQLFCLQTTLVSLVCTKMLFKDNSILSNLWLAECKTDILLFSIINDLKFSCSAEFFFCLDTHTLWYLTSMDCFKQL